MSRVIRVDPAVYADLVRLAGPYETPNDVLRRRLGMTGPRERGAIRAATGDLWPLMKAGLLEQDQELTWRRPKLHQSFTARVFGDGFLLVDGIACKTPNVAARQAAGYPALGWQCWRTAGGLTLAELRDRLPAATAEEAL